MSTAAAPSETFQPPSDEKVSQAIDVVLATFAHPVFPSDRPIRMGMLLSGGKDGIAAAHIAVRARDLWVARGGRPVEFVGIHCYLVKDLVFEAGPARDFCRAFGIPMAEVPDLLRISEYARGATYMDVDPDLGGAAKYAFEDQCIEYMDALHAPISTLGYKGDDNLGRRLYLKQAAKVSGITGLDLKLRRVMPVWRWTGREVYGYLEQHKLPIQARLKDVSRGGSLGVDFSVEVMGAIHDQFPEDYAKIKEMFPYVDVVLKRREFYGVKAQ